MRRMLALLDAHHRLGRFEGAAALAVDGEVVATWARGSARPGGAPLTPDTRLPIGSIAKPMTAVAVLQLAARGQLELHAPIGRYLPEGAVAWGDRVSVHHCLSHTGGIPSLFKAHWGVPSATTAQIAAPIARDALVRQFGGLPLRFEPGARFEYSNSGYVLLALAVERVAGRPFHDHLAGAVLAPTGAARIAPLDPAELEAIPMIGGAPAPVIHPSWQLGAGDLVASARDLARWHAGARALLPDAWGARLLAPHTPRYGYGYRLGARCGRRVAWHEGVLPGVIATVHRALDRDVAAVVLTNRIAGGRLARTWLNRLADQLVALGCGEAPPDPPGPARAFTPRELAELPGRYVVDPDRALVIARAGEGLRARAEGRWLLQGSGGPAEPDEEDVARVAARLVEAIRAARWEDVHAACSSVLRHLETPRSLADAWAPAIAQLGRLEDARLLLACGGIAWLRARFAGGHELDLQVITDEDGQSVAAFHVVPPDLPPAIAELPLVATEQGRLYADGFAAGAPDAWVEIDRATSRATVGRKHC